MIERYTEGKTKDEFLSSVQFQDSVIRRIEIIGEAIKGIHDEIKSKYPDIQWKKIAGMRDILIHEYFGIDIKLTWEVVTRDIPKLKSEMLKVREELGKK